MAIAQPPPPGTDKHDPTALQRKLTLSKRLAAAPTVKNIANPIALAVSRHSVAPTARA
jgi:hypothetical protein